MLLDTSNERMDADVLHHLEFVTHYVAQHGEDRWMHQHWSDLGLPEVGTFAEVGVGDGVVGSNTAWLESIGWTGLLIEPDPRRRSLIRSRRTATLVECAVGPAAGYTTFCLHAVGDFSSTLRTDGEIVSVPCRRLSDILYEHRVERLDMLSIDTEGTEMDVWGTMDLRRWRPSLVIIEWDTVGLPDRSREIIARMSHDGYWLAAKLGGNLLFRGG